jgi:plastocyanin
VRRARLRHRRALKSFREAPLRGVNNREWGHNHGEICGEEYGAPPCDRAEPDRAPGIETNQVSISGFSYLPGDRSHSGQMGAPVRVKRGTSLTFVNADQPLNIRHTATTCAWPCNGRLVSNYPNGDGVWDSGTLGYDLVDGGSPSPVASTPPDLPVGKYSYFCRIHPWMRGAFEVIE